MRRRWSPLENGNCPRMLGGRLAILLSSTAEGKVVTIKILIHQKQGSLGPLSTVTKCQNLSPRAVGVSRLMTLWNHNDPRRREPPPTRPQELSPSALPRNARRTCRAFSAAGSAASGQSKPTPFIHTQLPGHDKPGGEGTRMSEAMKNTSRPNAEQSDTRPLILITSRDNRSNNTLESY